MPDLSFSSLLLAASELVFPPACPLCRRALEEGPHQFCPECLYEMIMISEHKCPTCGAPFFDLADAHQCGRCMLQSPPFVQARSWGLYDLALAEAVRNFKFRRRHDLAELFAGLLSDLFDREMKDRTYEIIMPVPLHKRRLRERGYDQSTLVARRLALRKKIKLSINNLRRIRNTPPQYGLSLRQREQNVKGAFVVRTPLEVRDKSVLLVDDIYTTGATAKECCRVLKKAGAEAVGVITIARAV